MSHLCLVKGGYAYFTSQELHLQGGENWHKYGPDEPYLSDEYAVTKVIFQCESLDGPEDTDWKVSVEEVNRGRSPWLWTPGRYGATFIPAGVSVERFRELISEAGGTTGKEETL